MNKRYNRTKGSRARAVRKSHKRTCLGKVRYPSKDAAYAALRGLSRKDGNTLRVYRCACCRKHHLGNAAGSRLWRGLNAIKIND